MQRDGRAGESGAAAGESAHPVAAGILAPRLEAGLYLVATPIGTARDITLRALDVLNSADVLAAEDTRTLRHLMRIHGIPLRGRKIVSYHDHNAERSLPGLLAEIAAGRTVAYCSDAGTPLVADPGFRLSCAVTRAGARVHAVPGPSAVLAALSVSGQPTDRFLFAGFAPSQSGARKRWLAEMATTDASVVLFESPRRVKELLDDLCEIEANRSISVCRELTKKFEEVLRGTVSEVRDLVPDGGLRGEVVVVLGPPEQSSVEDGDIRAALAGHLQTMSLRDAAAQVATATGRTRKDVYRMALAMRNEGVGDGSDDAE